MARTKLRRYSEIQYRNNVLEDDMPVYNRLKGNWDNKYFKNGQPITLELACGKGHYTTGLAAEFPNRNFVGIDVKGDRLWVGSTVSIEENLENTAFLRAQIEHLDRFFESNEVSEIWITFPDPRPRKRDTKRRLTSPRFLELYKTILAPEGIVNFKTDNTGLFEYSLELFEDRNDITILDHTFDLYNSPLQDLHYGIKTDFEMKFLKKGENIKYMKFRFNNES